MPTKHIDSFIILVSVIIEKFLNMAKKDKNEIEIINQKRLIRLFRDTINNGQKQGDGIRFCFLLGAGTSVDSGIPSGSDLAKKWYKEISEDLDKDKLVQWRKRKKVVVKNLPASYPEIFEQRFIEEPQVGFQELQQLMENADPSIGYLILAKILSETRHSFVITTNFDHLVEDALFIATTKRPLVCGHESLAPYVHSQSQRPTIVKVHRDLLLDPFNQTKNTSILREEWVKALKPILKDFHLVVLGYGGNDGSLMDYLTDIPVSQRKKIFWCERSPENINDKILGVLGENGGKLVKIEGFDELMYELNAFCEIEDLIDLDNIEESLLIKNAREKTDIYRKKLDELGNRTKQQLDKGSSPSKALEKLLPDSWEYVIKASREEDLDKRDKIYEEGIKAFPKHTDLHLFFGWSLFGRQEKHERLKQVILKLDDLDPNKEEVIELKVSYLECINKNYDMAEKIYRKTVALDPESLSIIRIYSHFLFSVTKDFKKAEDLLNQALEYKSDDPETYYYYALLFECSGRIEQAKEFYQKCIEIKPRDSHYLLRFGGLLLREGDKTRGEDRLQEAFNFSTEITDFIAYWFFILVYVPKKVNIAKKELDRLLKTGVYLPCFDPSIHIEFAKNTGYKYISDLEDYSKKITKVK